MATRGLVLFLLTGFSCAVLFALFINSHGYSKKDARPPYLLLSENAYGSESKVWPELKFSWRIVLATVIGFLGSACATVGGVGGGGIFVPMLTLIVGFDTESTAAISKCMLMGACASSFSYNLRGAHPCRDRPKKKKNPCREVPIIDYNLAQLFQPMLMLGITIVCTNYMFSISNAYVSSRLLLTPT